MVFIETQKLNSHFFVSIKSLPCSFTAQVQENLIKLAGHTHVWLDKYIHWNPKARVLTCGGIKQWSWIITCQYHSASLCASGLNVSFLHREVLGHSCTIVHSDYVFLNFWEACKVKLVKPIIVSSSFSDKKLWLCCPRLFALCICLAKFSLMITR